MRRQLLAAVAGSLLVSIALSIAACSGDGEEAAGPLTPPVTGEPTEAGSASPGTAPEPADAAADATVADAADGGPPRRAIKVDTTDAKRHSFTFTAKQADAAATQSLGTQGAYLDTRVAAAGKLVVYLHGAGSTAPASCTSAGMADLLAPKGFHVLTPCYNSYYGVGNCGADIGGCRKEAFEGKDHSPVVAIAPPDAIEPRIVAAIKYLMTQHPGGDWGYFLEGGAPYWPDIIIAGSSHGASSAGLIGKIRQVDRVVMLSGPLDSNQAWLTAPSLTPLDRFYAFTHTGDDQHAGHLASFEAMKLLGAPVTVDGAAPPYGGSHRLRSSAATTNGHGATAPGGSSPKAAGGAYVYAPVWATMFGR